MAVYVISYDLNKAKNYDKLYEAIKGISGIWCRPVESTWYVQSNYTTIHITNFLLGYVDHDDVIVVSLTNGSGWSASLNKSAADWMRKHL